MRNHVELRAHDTSAQLQAALKQASDPILKGRLKAIVLRKQGLDPQEIANRLMVSDRAVRLWITRYNNGGTSGLVPKPPGRRKGDGIVWESAIFEQLAKEIDKGGYWSVPRMQEWLKKEKKKNIPEQTVWYRMDQLNYSYKSSRPSPIGGNTEKREAFKKGASLRSWSR